MPACAKPGNATGHRPPVLVTGGCHVQALITLQNMYEHLKEQGAAAPNEAEFRAYQLMLAMGEHGKYFYSATGFFNSLQVGAGSTRASHAWRVGDVEPWHHRCECVIFWGRDAGDTSPGLGVPYAPFDMFSHPVPAVHQAD